MTFFPSYHYLPLFFSQSGNHKRRNWWRPAVHSVASETPPASDLRDSVNPIPNLLLAPVTHTPDFEEETSDGGSLCSSSNIELRDSGSEPGSCSGSIRANRRHVRSRSLRAFGLSSVQIRSRDCSCVPFVPSTLGYG
ncbi:hypothetical protein Hdeb2414_s0001g00017901 [Helianthus debilis subsp. tardiflorus]